jgi:hypothetical protein
VRDYRTGLLPWVRGGDARLGERVRGAGLGIYQVAMRFILAQVIRVRWVRRRSALRQCRITWVRKAFTASLLRGPGTA